eukprot:3041680-Pleurochrysis_carterae.AAC.2
MQRAWHALVREHSYAPDCVDTLPMSQARLARLFLAGLAWIDQSLAVVFTAIRGGRWPRRMCVPSGAFADACSIRLVCHPCQ